MEHLPHNLKTKVVSVIEEVGKLPLDERVHVLNEIRRALHTVSPFHDEPVDLVLWVPADKVTANQYNPNVVAPPEMELLRVSIRSDGYTQPIVGFEDESKYEVVDGFHRNRIGKEDPQVREQLHGYLPLVSINEGRRNLTDRMAATVRHNRARGKHAVTKMSDIVIELTRRKWSDQKIAEELGMEPDEVLRLKQVTGIADLFKDVEFSEAWSIREVPE